MVVVRVICSSESDDLILSATAFPLSARAFCLHVFRTGRRPQIYHHRPSRTPIWCPKVVSNRSSSHSYSYNRVDNVSNDMLTRISRFRRCQATAPRLPRYANPDLSPISFYVLICSPICSSLKTGERIEAENPDHPCTLPF